MKFVFWQNMVSIHQSAFLKSLSRNNDVILIAGQSMENERMDQGWKIPSMGNAKVLVSPEEIEINRLLEDQSAIHVFSGIDGYPFVYSNFKKAISHNIKVSILAEPYDWRGWKGTLRAIKYRLLFLKYGNNISHLFVTGKKGQKCYEKCGFPKSKIHQWGYFTENSKFPLPQKGPAYSKVKLLFVGQLDDNKNIKSIINLWHLIHSKVDRFTIIGKGPLEAYVQDFAQSHSNVCFLGTQSNEEVQNIMSSHDILVLPSKYDGWGAVVNEALSVGTRVLCSEACGSSILLDGNDRGESFTPTTMKDVLVKWIDKGPIIQQDRKSIIAWSMNRISGTVAAKYFIDCFKDINAQAPWIVQSND